MMIRVSLGRDIVLRCGRIPTFQRSMLPPFLGSSDLSLHDGCGFQ